jgi:guanylate kinase
MSNDRISEYRRGIGGGTAFVVCGPSGAGKTSVIELVMQALPQLSYSVSFTTRPPRSDEIDGVDYHFISNAQFESLITNGDVLEYVTYLGHQYGTSRDQLVNLFAKGKDVILNIDVNGARTLMNRGLLRFSTVYIFLTPSSLRILDARLQERGTETERQVKLRLQVGAEEIKSAEMFDYLVINDQLMSAVDELRSIIVAERCRVIQAHD